MEAAPMNEGEFTRWEHLRNQAESDVESLIRGLDFYSASYEDLQSAASIIRNELLRCTDNENRFYAERLAKVLTVAENCIRIKEIEGNLSAPVH